MSRVRRRAPCERCGSDISRRNTRDGGDAGPVAHRCPHGKACVLPRYTSVNVDCANARSIAGAKTAGDAFRSAFGGAQ